MIYRIAGLPSAGSDGIRLAVRALAVFLLLSLFAVAAHAQVQDRKLEDRIKRPDMSMTYDLRQSSFSTNAAAPGKAVPVKDFGGNKAFASKGFLARTFSGSKTAWLTGMFRTKEANTKGKYETLTGASKYDTKSAAVKDARVGDSSFETASYIPSEKSYLRQGRSQERFNSEGAAQGSTPVGYTGDLRPMSIDDVRELLNKNK